MSRSMPTRAFMVLVVGSLAILLAVGAVPLGSTATAPHPTFARGITAHSAPDSPLSTTAQSTATMVEPSPTGNGTDALLATADLLNGTLWPGFYPGPHGTGDASTAYDPESGDTFVIDSSSDTLSVLDPEFRVIATIPVGISPLSAVYDPVGNQVFVADPGSNNLTVINASTFATVANIPVGDSSGHFASHPAGLAYDASTGGVFVTSSGGGICAVDNLTEYNGTTDRPDYTRQVGEDPYGLQYDPKSTLVYVENSCTDSVSVVNGTLGTIVRTLHPPAGVVSTGAVDDADNEIAVASYNAGGNLTFFNLTTGTTILTVPLGPLSLGIDALAFDAADDRFALAGGGPNLTFFSPSGTNRTVLLDEGTCLGGLEYVASTGAGDQSLLLTSDRCAAQVRALNATVFALDGTAITGRTASSLRSDPQTGDLYTSLSDGAGVAILNGSSLSEVGSVSGIVDPHFLAYDPADGTVWTACANSGNPQCLEGISQSTDEVTVSGKLPQNLYTAVDGLSWSSETGLLYVLAVTSPYYGGGYNVNTDLNLTPVDPASGDAYPNVTVVNFTGTIGSAHQPGLVSPTLAVPGTDLLVLADGNQNRVIGFNLSGLDTQWYTPVGGTPSALAYNATAGTIYVGVAGQDYLDVLSEATGALVRQIVTSFPSNGIVSDPINGRLYVSENLPSAANGLLQEFVGTGRSVENLTLRTDTSGVAFLPTTGTIAVAAPVSSGILIFGQALRAGPLTLQSSTAVQGEPATFTVVASEGYPPYSFNYTGVPGCTSTAGPTLTCAPTLAGIATLRVTVEDAAGETILEELPISVGPYPLSVGLSCTPSASHVLVNASAACSAVPNASEPVDVTDGLTFAWQIAPLLLVRLTNVTSAATQVEFLKAGNLTLTLIATFGNTSARASLSLEITGPATSGSPPGSSPPPGGNLTTVAVGIAVVAIVAVVAVLLVVRRRRSPPPGPATAPAAEPVRPSERLPTHEAPAVPAPATPSRDEDEHIYGG